MIYDFLGSATIVGFWFLLSVIAGYAAYYKGNSWFLNFAGALLFSPLVALAYIAFRPVNQDALDERKIRNGHAKACPTCAELVRPAAVVCRFCHVALDVAPEDKKISPLINNDDASSADLAISTLRASSRKTE